MNDAPAISKWNRISAIAIMICLVVVIGVATYKSVMEDWNMAIQGWLTALMLAAISFQFLGYWKSVLKRNKDSG